MPYSRSVLEMIGNTPMHEITRIDTGVCRLFVKLENQNPGGSIKDRIGLSIIEDAEKEGQLKAGGTIIEATAGNTGLGLALVAAQKGYRLILIIPDKMSADKVRHLRALGAEIILTRSDVPKGHPEYYQDMAERMVQEIPGAFWASQFDNPANPKAHETGTGPEIWEQMEGNLDAFVAGVGSGGTISGVGRFLKLKNQEIRIVVADPEGSVVARAVKTGEVRYEGGSWLVEGIGKTLSRTTSTFSSSTKGRRSATLKPLPRPTNYCVRKVFWEGVPPEPCWPERSSGVENKVLPNGW